MNVILERPSTAEAADWLASNVEAYTADLVAAGMDASAATEKARSEQTELLPLGLDTPGHLIFKVVDGDETVGWLWLGLRSPQGEKATGWGEWSAGGRALR